VPARLVLVGDGPERPRALAHATELGLREHVLFVGRHAAPEELLSCADLFLLPSASESFRASGAPAPAETDPKGEPAPPASYSISVPAAVRSDWGVGAASAVYVSLAATSTKPGPRALPKDPNKKPEDEKAATTAKPPARPAPRPPPRKNVEPDTTPIDLTVELVDTAGHVVRLPLSQFGIARKPLDARIYRRAGRDAARFSTIYELIPQTFVMPMSDFVATSPAFDPRQLATVRLVFDKTDAGTIVLEHVGLSTPVDPAFLSAPVR
jgi:hypothetical protein